MKQPCFTAMKTREMDKKESPVLFKHGGNKEVNPEKNSVLLRIILYL